MNLLPLSLKASINTGLDMKQCEFNFCYVLKYKPLNIHVAISYTLRCATSSKPLNVLNANLYSIRVL